MWKIVLIICVAITVCLLLLIGATTVKAEVQAVTISGLTDGAMEVRGFELAARGRVDIDLVGAQACCNHFFAYGWILDASSRELVWTPQDEHQSSKRISGMLYDCRDTITLRPGKYEVYYYVGPSDQYFGDFGSTVKDLGDVMNMLGELIKKGNTGHQRLSLDDIDELTIKVSSDQNLKSYQPVFEQPPASVFYVKSPRQNQFIKKGFSLSHETSLNIYAIGEISESYDVFVDGGWIINADTREKIWTMDKWNTDPAGGARKNRLFHDHIKLPAGNYIACYTSDDSHNPGEWNAPPPDDPFNYGISIATADPADIKYVSAYDESAHETPIVRIQRVRNDASEKAGFALKKNARLHILALGERNLSHDHLVDYGWIVNADNMEHVWEMTAENTGFAGGAAKNCMFDGIIDLPAGDYLVYYKTDDSHAYNDWNAAPPFDPDSWGISVSGVGTDFNAQSFALIDKSKSTGKVLVDLTRMGDDEDISREFTLTRPTTIVISALGEGKGDEMFDYGWIENEDTGQKIWKMKYRNTRPGGGADKNRLEVEQLQLEKGRYSVHFITDDSHSFDEFNASPPDDPEMWGIIVTEK
jgi:hypothetical protein